MERCWQPLLLLLLTAIAALNIHESLAAVMNENTMVKKLTNNLLQVIPDSGNSSTVTKLLIEGGLITLNDTDRLALASYPTLEELQLVGNRVTSIPAQYFSVVPHLKVLSLTGNKISSLDAHCFSGLDVLTELDLSNNLLTSLHSQLFKELNNLQVLNLQGNPWNCSCPLLSSIQGVQTAGVSIGYDRGARVLCASPEKQAGRDLFEAIAECYPSPTTTFPSDPQKPPTPATVIKTWGSSTMLKTTSDQKSTNKGPTPASGNTWMFTACVATLALCTCVIILCAIKGPSWYKLFHNYRHQRLHSTEEEEEGDNVSTVSSKTGRSFSQQTFTFQRENRQTEEEEEEEEEDGYIEDPYIKGGE